MNIKKHFLRNLIAGVAVVLLAVAGASKLSANIVNGTGSPLINGFPTTLTYPTHGQVFAVGGNVYVSGSVTLPYCEDTARPNTRCVNKAFIQDRSQCSVAYYFMDGWIQDANLFPDTFGYTVGAQRATLTHGANSSTCSFDHVVPIDPKLKKGDYTLAMYLMYSNPCPATAKGCDPLIGIDEINYGTIGEHITLGDTSSFTDPFLSFYSDSQLIKSGSKTKLHWSALNVNNCTASGGWSGSKSAVSGREDTQALTETTTFTLQCSGDTGSITRDIVVEVATIPTADIKANNSDGPITVNQNDSVTAKWTSQNAQTCSVTGFKDALLVPRIGLSGSVPVDTTKSRIVTVQCTGDLDQRVSDSVSVTIIPVQCNDGKDNDGDGKIDLADPGCTDKNDNNEQDPLPPPDSTKPSSPVLNTPTLGSGDASCSTVNLSWSASNDPESGIASYDVYRGGVRIAQLPNTQLNYSDTPLNPSTSYSYYIKAINGEGLVSQSNTQSKKTTACSDNTKPTKPTNVSASVQSCSSVQVTWTAGTDNIAVAGYNIYRNGTKVNSSLVTGTSYIDGAAPSNTSNIMYSVETVDSSNNTSSKEDAASRVTTPICSVGAKPDLIISVAPSLNSGTLTEGFNTTFKATVKNNGLASTLVGFNSKFYVDLNNDGSLDVFLTPDPSSSALAVNGTTQVVSGTWVAVAGTHRIVVCADDPSAITESDETNNCSNTTGGSNPPQGTGIITVGTFQQF